MTISDEEFERNVERAVSAIAEKHQAEIAELPMPNQLSEKSDASKPERPARQSMEGESSAPRKSTSSNENDSGDGLDEKAMGYQRNAMLRSNQMLKLRPLTQANTKNELVFPAYVNF